MSIRTRRFVLCIAGRMRDICAEGSAFGARARDGPHRGCRGVPGETAASRPVSPDGPDQLPVGMMFWFTRKRLVGS
jgi:hypothetical protein